MEPTLPQPKSLAESQHRESAEVASPEGVGPSVELTANVAALPREQVTNPQPSSNPLVPAQPIVAQPVLPVIPVIDDSTPQIADDVDVIEKEWVDRAKHIVAQTKSDPREQEKRVSHLQADYMMKRYNKKVKIQE